MLLELLMKILFLKLKKTKIKKFKISEENKEDDSLLFNNKLLAKFQAHKGNITTLSILNLSEKYILTSGFDSFVKIWNMEGILTASVNINHPLPIIWNVKVDFYKKTRKNILFALKIVELIFKRYKKNILLAEEKLININSFLSKISAHVEKTPFSNKNSNNNRRDFNFEADYFDKEDNINIYIEEKKLNTSQLQKKNKKLLLMKDEYSPRDLQFEKIKHLFQRELTGASLKEMESNKRIFMTKKMIKEQSLNKYEELFPANHKFEEDLNLKERDPLAFFQPDFHDNMVENFPEEDFNELTQKFSKKLDNCLKKKNNELTFVKKTFLARNKDIKKIFPDIKKKKNLIQSKGFNNNNINKYNLVNIGLFNLKIFKNFIEYNSFNLVNNYEIIFLKKKINFE